MKLKKYLLGTLVLVISISLSSCNNQKKPSSKVTSTPKKENVTNIKKVAKLESSKVCYVNNKFMGINQIPVLVDNKTYYGCCEACVSKLKENLGNVRFSIDPLTGEKVDKATAYIVLKPNSGSDVLYFASEKNYLEFSKL